ncbi:MAG TPA: VOC family protein [Candidatus Didemnitutus sp.]|nr:VOC family protein [Candidatus Didemnitutus sp.]
MNANTSKIVPCLWYNGDAEEAVAFVVSLVPGSSITKVFRSPTDTPSGPAGKVLTVEFTLGGSQFLALNGGPQFSFTPAVSFQIHCDNQAEVDRIWAAILKNGGKEMACSWITDRWGLAWQIVPRRLTQLLADPDTSKAKRVMEAMMEMVKIDIAGLERAADAGS